MADDWKPGDTAVCIVSDFGPAIQKDAKYVVTAVELVPCFWHGAHIALAFAGKKPERPYVGWSADGFRKLPPPEPIEEPRVVSIDEREDA